MPLPRWPQTLWRKAGRLLWVWRRILPQWAEIAQYELWLAKNRQEYRPPNIREVPLILPDEYYEELDGEPSYRTTKPSSQPSRQRSENGGNTHGK